MEDCLFCKIISGEIPVHKKIYEDEHTLAFLDISPINHGHTIVIPKRHARNLLDIEESDWIAVMKVVRMLVPKIKEGMSADGINIGMNNEAVAGQSVLHSHVHIIPRFKNDGYEIWKGGEYKDDEAEVVVEKIRSAIR